MSYLTQGRVQQKLRTRNVLIDTAAQLIREKKTFTTGEVADIANVGRTTAYRYFPTLDEMLAAATHRVVLNEAKDRYTPVIKATESKSYAERLQALIDANDASVAGHEHEFRTILRLNLEKPPSEAAPRRPALRPDIFREFLAGIEAEIGEERLRRLSLALSLFVGVEASVVLGDMCGLSRRQARKIKNWGTQALLAATLAEAKAAHSANGSKVVGRAAKSGREKPSSPRRSQVSRNAV